MFDILLKYSAYYALMHFAGYSPVFSSMHHMHNNVTGDMTYVCYEFCIIEYY